MEDCTILGPVTERPATVRAALHEQFARIGKAVASPKRIELLELLCQGERSVDALARATAMGITNTSQHLQVLKAAHLVEIRRAGTRIYYRAADDQVCRFASELGAVARGRLVEVEHIARRYIEAPDTEEYRTAHIRGALSLPLAGLRRHLRELPRTKLIVAYCRGPYCVLAPQALALLRARGFSARRLEDGLPEWRAAGLPIASGS